jgi:hypothetical protein
MGKRRFARRPFVVGVTGEHPAGPAASQEDRMRYLLLIYTAEPADTSDPNATMGELDDYNTFTQWTIAQGLFKAGEALHPTSAATTVQVRNGKTITTDGPYAETKEALGGFYMIEARDLDEAIDAAARIPGARHGSIEVRPIFDFPSGDSAEAVGAAG